MAYKTIDSIRIEFYTSLQEGVNSQIGLGVQRRDHRHNYGTGSSNDAMIFDDPFERIPFCLTKCFTKVVQIYKNQKAARSAKQ